MCEHWYAPSFGFARNHCAFFITYVMLSCTQADPKTTHTLIHISIYTLADMHYVVQTCTCGICNNIMPYYAVFSVGAHESLHTQKNRLGSCATANMANHDCKNIKIAKAKIHKIYTQRKLKCMQYIMSACARMHTHTHTHTY